MRACASIPCCVAELDAIINVEENVSPPSDPVYRNLSTQIELAAGKCVVNLDGSMHFVLKLADVVLTDEEIKAAIESGKYRDTVDYYEKIQRAAMTELLRNFKANGVEFGSVFALNENQSSEYIAESPINAIDPFAYIGFIDELMHVLLHGHDMIVCIPPIVDGKPNMEKGVVTSVAFHYPTFPNTLWLPGLVHNDVGGEGATHGVEGDYFIFSNVPLGGNVVEGSTSIRIELLPTEQFQPSNAEASARLVGVALPHKTTHNSSLAPLFEDDDTDYTEWRRDCAAFQDERVAETWKKMGDVCDGMNLAFFDRSKIYLTNLVGWEMPKNTTGIKFDSRKKPSGSDIQANMRAARAAAREKNSSEPSSATRKAPSPVREVAISDAQDTDI